MRGWMWVRVQTQNQITLPEHVRAELDVQQGDELAIGLAEAGELVLAGNTGVPADQRWFWDPTWQAGEREASQQIARGALPVFDDADELFAAVDTGE